MCLYACSERISRLLLALGDEYKEMKMMSEGNIAVVAGLKHVRTIIIIAQTEPTIPYIHY